MAKFIKVYESNYKQIKETLVNVNRIAYIQANSETNDNNAIINVGDDNIIYTMETVQEIREKIMSL